jgi:ABC-type bacteriocin/lantibiotic exporter with double-glycine peptidase domain
MPLDVPVEYQEDDYSCTPVCISMVLKYIKNKFRSGFPDLSLDTISKTIKTSADEGGTTFRNIKNINDLFKKTSQFLEIAPEYGQKFEDITQEIKIKEHPVIAWVMMSDPIAPYPHSVVITDVDEDKLIIYCNDPVYGRVEIPTRQFTEMWNGCSRILIKFKIGEKVTLFDFP